jgi:F-box/TPR repeat protein Pof3
MVTMALERIKADDTKRRVELSKLKEDVLDAQRQVDEHKRRVQYHFGKLPTEIFAEIFRLLVSEDHTRLLVLLHVSKAWRDIVWHTPSLWDTLVITHRNPTRKVALWINRTKGRIRELRVRVHVLRNLDWSFDSLRGLKWDKLRVCKIEAWDLAQYLESISMSHILFTLDDLQIDDLSAPSPDRCTLFPENSGLRVLNMSHCHLSWSVLAAHVGNLTYLAAHGCDGGNEMLLALEANPNLETLIIESSHNFAPLPPSHTTPLLLSKLTHLEVEGADGSSILEQLSFQNLRILRIYRVTGSLDYGLCDALGKGLNNLVELRVSRCSVTPAILISLLQQTMLLETLELSHLSYTVNEVIEALTIPLPVSTNDGLLPENSDGAAAKMMCPFLAHLDVSHSPDIKTGPLVRLIKSRSPNTVDVASNDGANSSVAHTMAKIVSLTADGCPLIDPDWLPWFRKSVQTFSCVFMTKKNAAWKR